MPNKRIKNSMSENAIEHNKRIKQKRQRASGIASFSFLISLFDKLCEVICNALVGGFWGQICSGYSKLEASFKQGFLIEFLLKDRKIRKICRSIRRFLSRHIENCFIVTQGRKTVSFFSTIPLNYYGNFGLFFGLYVMVVYFVKMIIPDIESAEIDYLIIGIITVLLSIPLLFSWISVSAAILKSSISKLIFRACLGISEETLDKHSEAVKGKGNLMLFLGLAAGILAFFVHPIKIIIAILAIFIIGFIAVSPEIGVLLTIFIVPFLSFFKNPTISLCICVLATLFFYLIKLIRGKRIFKLELLDGIVLLFGLIIGFSSIFSAGGADSRKTALVSCTLIVGYFLVVNLMRTEKWIKRCVGALVSSASIVALCAAVEYFVVDTSSKWLDVSLFSGIRTRAISFFGNPNVLATFLVLAFPFALIYFIFAKTKSEKFLSIFVCFLFVVATVFTWSRGAWIAIAVSALIFFTVYSKKTLRIFPVLLLGIPVIPIILPDNIVDRLLSIVNLSDSSISYRIYTWMGSIRMIRDHWIGGIGYGSEAFKKIYPSYALSGIEAAEHSHNLFLQVLICLGIGGALTLILLLFLYFQRCSEYIKKPENAESKFYTTAAFVSVLSAVIMGVFDYIWFNHRVFFVFWIVVAIGAAFIRIGNNERERNSIPPDEHSTFDRNELD